MLDADTGKITKTMNSGEMPWHKAGARLDRPHSAHDAVLAAGLGWTVVKKERAGGKYVLVREDLSDHTKGILGPVKSDYIPLQNIEAFSFLDEIVNRGTAVYDSAGTLDEGRWVWIIPRFPGDLEILPEDPIGRFLLLAIHLRPAIIGWHISPSD